MIADKNLQEYWKSLDRIVRGCPNKVNKGEKISNDLVSLEAGRQKGSIKKSREQFKELINAIDLAALEQEKKLNKEKHALKNLKQNSSDLRMQLDASLQRELSLLLELFETKKKLSLLTGEKVVPMKINNLR